MAISTAIDNSQVARAVGIKTTYEARRGQNTPFLPQRVAIIGQGADASTYSTTKFQASNADEVGAAVGYGSPLHLVARTLFPRNGDGLGTIPATFYPLEAAGTGVAAVFDVTPVGTATAQGTFYVTVNKIRSTAFVMSVGDTVADFIAAAIPAVNAVLAQPVIASDGTTTLTLTSKWSGSSGNDIEIEIEGPTNIGLTFSVAATTPGAVNPDVDTALAQVGGVWETLFINCMEVADTATLDKFKAFGEGREGALVHMPCAAIVGLNETTVAAATAVSDARKTDFINIQIPAPSSKNLPFVIAADAVRRIAVRANNNPPRDYGSLKLDQLTAGPDGDQWDNAKRNEAVTKGSSTTVVKDGVVNMQDAITFYHPTGEEIPPYRFLVDRVRQMNITYNLALVVGKEEWDGAPLIPDFQATTNPDAISPKVVRAALKSMTAGLADDAIVSDPETINKNTLVEINSDNPKRLDIVYPAIYSGNGNIYSVDHKFSFFFGGSTVTA